MCNSIFLLLPTTTNLCAFTHSRERLTSFSSRREGDYAAFKPFEKGGKKKEKKWEGCASSQQSKVSSFS